MCTDQRPRDVSASRGRAALEVSRATVGFRWVIGVTGEIDIGTVATLHAALEEVVHSGGRDVWIDLTAVRFLDVTGLHTLLEAKRQLHGDRRPLTLICPPGPIQRLLEVTGLDLEFTTFRTRADAHRFS